MGLFQIRKLSDEKYLAFIMTHFLLIMPYQWYGIIKANVIMRTAVIILSHDIILSSKNEQNTEIIKKGLHIIHYK